MRSEDTSFKGIEITIRGRIILLRPINFDSRRKSH